MANMPAAPPPELLLCDESLALQRAVLESSSDAIIGAALDGTIISWSAGAERHYGFTAGEILGQNISTLTPPDLLAELPPLNQRIGRGESVARFETERLAQDGSRLDVSITLAPMRGTDGNITGLVSIERDITERKRVFERLRQDAFSDSLTGLPNRNLFMDRLEHVFQLVKRRQDYACAVLFLDFDRFKLINDSLGHLSGDRFLKEIGQRLNACVRPSDTVARLGGDEFTILLDGVTGPSDGTRVAERIEAALVEPITLGGQEIFASVSIGIAVSTPEHRSAEELMRDADTAMYRAKARGRARYEIFDQEMHQQVKQRLQLEMDLRRAMERNELSVRYQPVLSMGRGTITGFEALVQWNHPQRGLVPATDFIPLAEETGMIVALDRWVWGEACRQTMQWRAEASDGSQIGVEPGHDLTISVNVSSRHLAHSQLADHVRQVLSESGLPAPSLHLEVTEKALLDQGENAAVILQELRDLGVELVMDDFGTGYSSLSYLHKMPLDTVKIDRSFIGTMGSEVDNEMVSAMLQLAVGFGKNVVAEGVETAEQMAQLRDLNCNLGQGYLFSRPVDSNAAGLLLRTPAQES